MKDRLSKAEIRKDALQDGVTAASQAVGAVTTIVTTAIGDLARTMGGFATEIFEIRDSARRASQDHLDVVPANDGEVGREPDEPVEPPAEPGQAPKRI